jgi:hypothetical protein
MNASRRRKMFLGSVAAVLAVVGLAAAVSYSFPSAGISTTTTTATVKGGQLTNCGFLSTCAAYDPSGLVLSLSINTTTVLSNGSFGYAVSLVNPTSQFVNLSKSNGWYMPGLLSPWPCASSPGPYGFAVFKGYYTLQNATRAKNVLHQAFILGCTSTGVSPFNVTSYSLPPHSTFVSRIVYQSSQIYAINGGFLKSGNFSIGVNSLWSSEPAVYTMVAGDEWGGFALLHFSVVAGSG